VLVWPAGEPGGPPWRRPAMGALVSLEGGDRSGKSTQVRLLKAHLESRKVPHVLLREPGSTAVGEVLRRLLLHSGPDGMEPLTELFLFAAARAQLVREVIRPCLARGLLVVVDRYLDSTVAYQGYGLGINLEIVRTVNRWATDGVVPEITILFDADPAGTLDARDDGGAPDRIEARGLAYHRRVREGYLDCAAREPERIRVIDATAEVMEVHRQVREHLEPLLAQVSGT